MPFGNRMGPQGTGPKTGRSAGFCAGYEAPGYGNPVWHRGFGRGGRCGRGEGHGWRHWFYATGLPGWARTGWGASEDTARWQASFSSPTREQEIEELKAQAKYFKESLDGIGRRIEELELQSDREK